MISSCSCHSKLRKHTTWPGFNAANLSGPCSLSRMQQLVFSLEAGSASTLLQSWLLLIGFRFDLGWNSRSFLSHSKLLTLKIRLILKIFWNIVILEDFFIQLTKGSWSLVKIKKKKRLVEGVSVLWLLYFRTIFQPRCRGRTQLVYIKADGSFSFHKPYSEGFFREEFFPDTVVFYFTGAIVGIIHFGTI